nr:glyoxalase/bleomycin resistance/extradiol dioxygenase family protein [Corynebacterium ulceribovis]
MAIRFSPYISFPGNAREAMTYYQDMFGGELNFDSYDGMEDMLPFTPPKDAVAHAELVADGVIINGGDAMGETLPPLKSDVYSFLLSFDSVEEATAVWEKFVQSGAAVAMPFEMAPWGQPYGQIKDRFDVLWAFSA